ncbi:MAG: hypothetical protein ACREDZ_15595 [Kiloniellales bacterium]
MAAHPAFAITSDQAATQVAEAYGVEVLKVREGQVDNRPVWLVTFMAPGGNSNIAFQVNTIALDRDSGEEISAFQHTPMGYELPGAPQYDTRLERQPRVMRLGTWR